ncbi:MAG: PEP-CTERM sorting domain-containing protein [Leptolyngbyaceae cyanobacterium]
MRHHKTLLISSVLGSLGAIALSPEIVQAATYTLDFDRNSQGNLIDVSDLGIAVGNWEKPENYSQSDFAVNDQWLADFGVSISTNKKDAVLFNTNPDYYANGTSARKNNGDFKGAFDDDLLTGDDYLTYKTEYQDYSTDLGNVLIIQERNAYWKPDDEGSGGTISFDFEKSVSLSSIDLLDIDEFRANKLVKFTAIGENDTVIGSWNFDESSAVQLSEGNGDNSLYRFNFDAQGVKQLNVIYPGSGAISALRWDEDTPTIPEPTTVLGLFAIAGLGLRMRRMTEA